MPLYSITPRATFSDSAVAQFGASVALSADGKTAVIGAPQVSSVYVSKLSGGMWGPLQIIASDLGTAFTGSAGPEFLVPVAVSSDGSVILFGEPGASSAGACTSVVNGIQSPTFAPQISVSFFGCAVALSYDGNTAVIGAFGSTSQKGAAYIFTRSGVVWTQQAILTHTFGFPGDGFGTSVSISADGNTAIVGAPGVTSPPTTSYAVVFVHSDATWTQQALLTSGVTLDGFGISVSISADAGTVLVGAYNSNSASGTAYVFTNFDGTWPLQKQLQLTSDITNTFFGFSTALSCNGNIALIGAPGYNTGLGPGAVLFFTRSGAKWSSASDALPQMISDTANNTNQPISAPPSFGGSVSLSANGLIALVGDPSYPNASNQGLAALYLCGYDIPNITCFQTVGPPGPQGPSGPIGPTGVQGPIGFRGPAGANLTASAYLSQIILFALLLYGGFLLIFFTITFC